MAALSAMIGQLQPRDQKLAARVASVLAAVAGAVTALFTAIQPPDTQASSVGVVIALVTGTAVTVVAGLMHRLTHHDVALWAALPFTTIGLIVMLDLVTRDASTSAQVFFLFPALYAAFQLRRTGALMVSAAAIGGDLVVVFLLLPPREAAVSSGYLIAVIATCVALLVVSGERQDALVAQLKHQAAVDPLTGLFTRRVLDTAASTALTGASSELGTGLILIDIDNFKTINDGYGHPAGDQVLVQLAKLLLDGTRPTDTVSRLGGDEIAVLIAGCSVSVVTRRAEQILWDVRTHPFLLEDATMLPVSISVGIAHLPTHGTDLRSLYSAADSSLYSAKRAGRDQIGPLPEARELHDRSHA